MPRESTIRRDADEDLVRRAQRGCRESFDEVMRRYQTPMLHFLRARSTAAEPEDLLQETFLRAYRGLPTYCDDYAVRTWLFTIARRVCIDSRRRERPRPLAYQEISGNEPEPSSRESDREQRGALWAAARRLLSEAEQTSLWLHYIEDMTIREVAAVLGRSPTATKVMMFRARRALLQHLPDVLPDLVDGLRDRMRLNGNQVPEPKAPLVSQESNH